MKGYFRFAAIALLLAGTALVLQAHNKKEILPAHQSLNAFPEHLGEWTGQNLEISPEVLSILGPGEFLLRNYHDGSVPQPDIDLFLAYFPSQRTGDTIHSPRHCLPGAGWSSLQHHLIVLTLPGHEPFPANYYVIGKGGERSLVIYWYWAHNRGVASEYWAKFYLIADSMRMNRSDGALVRVITSILPAEGAGAAEMRLRSFAEQIGIYLNSYVPR